MPGRLNFRLLGSLRGRFLFGALAALAPLIVLAVLSYGSFMRSLNSLDGVVEQLFVNFNAVGDLHNQLQRIPQVWQETTDAQFAAHDGPLFTTIKDIDMLFDDVMLSSLAMSYRQYGLEEASRQWQALRGQIFAASTDEAPMDVAQINQALKQIQKSVAQFQATVHNETRSNLYTALQERKDSILLIAATSFFGLLLALTAIVLIYLAVFDPLRKARKSAEKILSGDLTHRVESHDTGELGKIAEAFNCMAGMIKSNQTSINLHTIHDALTGLINRREFKVRLATELERARRYSKPFALMMVDVDNFTLVNETWGHISGDEALRIIAVTLSREVRPVDTVVRYGNDDFIIILPEIGVDDALNTGERLRKCLESHPITLLRGSKPMHLTVSIGISIYPDDGESIEELLEMVTASLESAKHQGGNQVVISNAADENTEIPV